ncbi:MFS transporter [Thalassotalea agarivorans]|uniref:Sugar phosphate permease n=1 Tax=Thalassotalea agarivorans TaxID=349064 RepID=A0A1H9YM73_THASX|nr:MFS transporter [Thalassotalea agarivorans]SES70138.1 Sugar phosphate permease [Thalassotalea agarivorans]
MTTIHSPLRRAFVIFTIVLAGELIFSLPFHVVRFFRPTFLEVFNLTNTQLGDIFGLYGILAMLVYFPGGPLADRFSARKLMMISLLLTASGSLYFAQIPSASSLGFLFAFWGVTTIFLFWAAMIKLTRIWGGAHAQGKAFAILDGGRGLVAAAAATGAVAILTLFVPDGIDTDLASKRQGIQSVIYYYGAITTFAAFIVFLVIPKESGVQSTDDDGEQSSIKHDFSIVLKRPVVWLQGMIVLTAYCGYKGLDYFGLYLTNVLDFGAVQSAQTVAYISYTRVFAALCAGFLADKIGIGKTVLITFSALVVCYALFATSPVQALPQFLVLANIIVTFVLVFAVRAIYFALLEESKIADTRTGAAVGVISVVGYTPDIFLAPVAGRLIDANPGVVGFSHLFIMLGLFSAIGAISTYLLIRRVKALRAA